MASYELETILTESIDAAKELHQPYQDQVVNLLQTVHEEVILQNSDALDGLPDYAIAIAFQIVTVVRFLTTQMVAYSKQATGLNTSNSFVARHMNSKKQRSGGALKMEVLGGGSEATSTGLAPTDGLHGISAILSNTEIPGEEERNHEEGMNLVPNAMQDRSLSGSASTAAAPPLSADEASTQVQLHLHKVHQSIDMFRELMKQAMHIVFDTAAGSSVNYSSASSVVSSSAASTVERAGMQLLRSILVNDFNARFWMRSFGLGSLSVPVSLFVDKLLEEVTYLPRDIAKDVVQQCANDIDLNENGVIDLVEFGLIFTRSICLEVEENVAQREETIRQHQAAMQQRTAASRSNAANAVNQKRSTTAGPCGRCAKLEAELTYERHENEALKEKLKKMRGNNVHTLSAQLDEANETISALRQELRKARYLLGDTANSATNYETRPVTSSLAEQLGASSASTGAPRSVAGRESVASTSHYHTTSSLLYGGAENPPHSHRRREATSLRGSTPPAGSPSRVGRFPAQPGGLHNFSSPSPSVSFSGDGGAITRSAGASFHQHQKPDASRYLNPSSHADDMLSHYSPSVVGSAPPLHGGGSNSTAAAVGSYNVVGGGRDGVVSTPAQARREQERLRDAVMFYNDRQRGHAFVE